MQDNPFAKYARPAARAPINTGVNPTAVNAERNTNRADAQFQYQQQRDAMTDAKEREKLEREQAMTAQAMSSSAESVARTVKILESIRADANDSLPGLMGERGWGETGFTGNVMRSIPWVSNAGKDLERKVATVKGLNAFTALKDLASQGVKLTPISNAEIELAASSVANIDPTLTQREFLAAVDQAIEFHKATLKKLTGSAPAKPTTNRTAPPSDIQAIMRKYGGR